MPDNNHKQDRRDFIYKSSMASLGLLIGGKAVWGKGLLFDKPNSKFFGVQIGVITYSFRSLPGAPEQLLQYCINSGINAIELMGDSIEDYAGKPKNNVKLPPRVAGQPQKLTEEQKQQLANYQQQVADWRGNVSMEAFKKIRKLFNKSGVSIYAFKPNALNANNTDAEILYALKAAKALGAKSVTTELPKDPALSQRLGSLAEQEKVFIAYHAHTQASNTAWDTALAQSPYNSINLDCGHYIAAGGDNTAESLLDFIQSKHDRITSLHIKDRKSKINGGENKVWGEGDTPLKNILTLLKQKKYNIPATIELEYDIPQGSDPVKETAACLAYAKKILEA